MNLKNLLLLMLVGIVCSVSVVSAADINDTAVEIQTNDATISVDELQNDITIQKFEDNTTDEVKTPVESDNVNSTDESALGQNNTTSDDVKKINDCRNAVCSSASNTGLHFNLCDNTAKNTQKDTVVTGAVIGGAVSIAPNLLRDEIRWGLRIFQKKLVEINEPVRKANDEIYAGWLAIKALIKG